MKSLKRIVCAGLGSLMFLATGSARADLEEFEGAFLDFADVYIAWEGQDLNSVFYGVTELLDDAPLPEGVTVLWGDRWNEGRSELRRWVVVINESPQPVTGVRLLLHVNADIVEGGVPGGDDEYALVMGTLGIDGWDPNADAFQVHDPGWEVDDLVDNLVENTLDDTVAFSPAALGDVSVALAFDLPALSTGEAALFEFLVSEEGRLAAPGAFGFVQLDIVGDFRSVTISGTGPEIVTLDPPTLDNGTVLANFGALAEASNRFGAGVPEPSLPADIVWQPASLNSLIRSWEGQLRYMEPGGSSAVDHLLADPSVYAPSMSAVRLGEQVIAINENGEFRVRTIHELGGDALVTRCEVTNITEEVLIDVDLAWLLDAVLLPNPSCGNALWNGTAGEGYQTSDLGALIARHTAVGPEGAPLEWEVGSGSALNCGGGSSSPPADDLFLFVQPFSNSSAGTGEDLAIVTNFSMDDWFPDETLSFVFRLEFGECPSAGGPSPDCDQNGIADDCDIAYELDKDCNVNGVPDSCDLAGGGSLDADGNGVPDECQQVLGMPSSLGTGDPNWLVPDHRR